MSEIRAARPADRDGFRALWELCFQDGASFTDWFFENRFLPEYSACADENGRVVSAMQGIPLHLNVRGTLVPAVMIAGVSTHPDFRRRGLMAQVMRHILQQARTLGAELAVHTPVDPRNFFPHGQLPVSDTAWLNIAAPEHSAQNLTEIDPVSSGDALFGLYAAFSRRYSGICARSYADFRFKMRDYASDGARCFALDDGAPRGYYICFDSGDSVLAEEVVAADSAALQTLIGHMSALNAGRNLTAKLPPDLGREIKAPVPVSVEPQGSAGIVNLPALLKRLVNLPEFIVAVSDSAVPQNCGTFTLDGTPSSRPPVLEIDSGSLTQFLFGYRSLAELAERPSVTVFDPDAAVRLDRLLPKQCCFIIDEY